MTDKKIMFNIPVPDIMLTSRCNLNCKYCFEHEKEDSAFTNENIREFIKKNTSKSYFPFGGEPLLAIDNLADIIEDLKSNVVAFDDIKKRRLRSMRHIITNGTLIKYNIDKIKKSGLSLQISLDGPKQVNDINRVDYTNKGSFDKIIESIELCQENEIEWSVHGVVNKETLPYLFETTVFFIDLLYKYKGIKEVINALSRNMYQIIFEEDYTDNDIDLLLNGVVRITEWISSDERFSDVYKDMIRNFFKRKGGMCAAGTTLFALDPHLNITSCHRNVLNNDYTLGNVYDAHNFKNYNLFNSYYRQKMYLKKMYNAYDVINGLEIPNWLMWCPSTNKETTGSIYFQNPKYTTMFIELNHLIVKLQKYYDL